MKLLSCFSSFSLMEMLEIVFLVVGGFRFMDLLDDVTLLYAGKKKLAFWEYPLVNKHSY